MHVPPPGNSRDRVLTAAELGKMLKLVQSARTYFEAIVSQLILTGQRRGEIAALEWNWIAGDTITLPASLTKNGRQHTFPVGPMTLRVLERIPKHKDCFYVFPTARNRFKDRPATVFNGWSKSKVTFVAKIKIAPWTLHDLRRTLRTEWAELRVPREVAERYINHVSGVHSGIAAVYDHYSYLDEMRTAVSRWEERLQNLLKD